MPTELDLSTIVKKKIRACGVPDVLIASLSGISSGHFSNWMRDKVQLERPIALRVYDKMLEIEQLAKLVSPLLLDYRRTAIIKNLLELLAEGDLDIQITTTGYARLRSLVAACESEVPFVEPHTPVREDPEIVEALNQ